MKLDLKKTIITLLIVVNVFSLTALPVYADLLGVSLGNPMSLMDSVFGELGIDKNELKNGIQTMNVSRRKINPPMVSVTFDPADPVPGETVTATAMPTYFTNSIDNLYFTWYLKGAKCTDKKTPDEDYSYNKDCDLDDDGEVDIEDYKIKAMRIIVDNDFDWQNADYSKDADDDGYESVFGGDDQREKPASCYVRDVSSGDDYEVDCHHFFPNAPSDTTGDGQFNKSEEKFWRTDPNNNDTATTGNPDEANVTGLGENTFSFPYTTGDKVGVVVEGVAIQSTQDADSSYKTMWAFTENKCEPTNLGEDTGYPKTTGPDTETRLNTPTTDYTTTITTTTTKDILDGTQIADTATIRTTTTTHTVVTYVGTDPGLLATNPISDETTTTNTCSRSDIENGVANCSGLDEENVSITMTDMDSGDMNDCLYQNLITPSEGGGATEKLDVSLEYLPQNPNNDSNPLPSTYVEGDPKGNGDELSFTATATNATNDTYLNYTWTVYGSDEPNPDDWGSPLSKDILDGSTSTSGLGINTFKFNLNFKDSDFSGNAFTNNIIPKYLKVVAVVNDSLEGDAGSREGHANVILPIFSSQERIRVYTARVTTNNNKLLIIPNADGSDPAAPIPVAQERCLFIDPTNEDADPMPQSVCAVAPDEIITLAVDNTGTKYSDFLWTINGKTQICPDENFYGCIKDDKATERTYFPVLGSAGSQYNIELSMLNIETGEKFSLTRVFKVVTPDVKIVPLDTDNHDASGNQTCKGLLLGNYYDFNNVAYEDRSETVFQALTNNNIVLTPVFSGTDGIKDFNDSVGVPSSCPYVWNIDGVDINADNAASYGYSIDTTNYGKLTLPQKETGKTYLVSFSTTYTPTNATREALNKYWNISYNGFYERTLTHNIEIAVTSAGPLAKNGTSPKKIFATVSSGIPTYIAFLFRVALSGIAIILALKIVFFILPKTKIDEF
ncbi:MAG: hypothetical protein WC848_01885 [Parcubacteria group bacterium]|jgi:hypothetical protein